jgi:uncharacterized membrane protein YfcA
MPTKFFGAFLHNRQRAVNWQLVKNLCSTGLPATIFGAFSLVWLHQHIDIDSLHNFTRRAVGMAVLAAAFMIVITPWLVGGRERGDEPIEWTPSLRLRVAAIGAIVGLIVAFTSIGSGAVTLPLMALALPLVGLRDLVGSDIAFAALLIPTAFLGHWSTGDVNYPMVTNLLIGSLPGVFIGSKLCGIVPQSFLRPAVAVTLAFVGAHMVWN